MKINSKTELYCIFGHPVEHSMSPLIHNRLFSYYGMNKSYMAFDITNIKKGVDAIRTLNIQGASITIPHKISIMKHLDKIDPLACSIGAVNTVLNKDGILSGFNTDGLGLLRCFKDKNLEINGKTLLILGSGGVAKSAFYSLISEYKFSEIIMAGIIKKELNQFKKKAESLKLKFTAKFLRSKYKLTNEDVIVNCSPVGMTPKTRKTLIEKKTIKKNQIFFDAVYTPSVTQMLNDAKKKKAMIISGKQMFINQAMLQHKIWTDNDPDEKLIKKII